MEPDNIKYQPGGFAFGTIFAFMILYSPYIISVMSLLYSVVSQSLSGIVYLGYVTLWCFFGFLINWSQGPVTNPSPPVRHTFCPPYMFFVNNNPIRYPNKISLNSIFFGVTMGYILEPMVNNDTYNIILLVIMGLTSCLGFYAENLYNCINGSMMSLIWWTLYLFFIGIGWLGSWLAGQHDLGLYFITNKNNWICSKPDKKQRLKCRIVKKKIPLSN